MTVTTRIAVCDDEAIDCQQILQLTKTIMQEQGRPCELYAYASGAALLEALKRGAQFHILLLDVLMAGMDGIELAANLRRHGDNTAIIFISVNREMALQGYEVAALRYLAKPVRPTLLQEALLFCCQSLECKEILLPTGKGQRRIVLANLVYAEAAGRCTKLFLTEQQEEYSLKFSNLTTLLPEEQFVLCHRSYLVNLKFVSYLRRQELELTTGARIPVSKYRQEEVRRRLMNYLKN